MNIELKPIAESKVRQLGGDVCGVLVRKDGKTASVDEHGRVTWLRDDHGDEYTAYLEGMNSHLKAELEAARAQSGQGVPESDLLDRMRALEADHEPTGWPSVQMRDISALCDLVEAARAQPTQQGRVPEGFEALRRSDGIMVTRMSDGGCAFYEKDSRLVTQVVAYHFLDALLSTPTTPQTEGVGCEWHTDDNGCWMGACGKEFWFEDGGPSDNGMKYCLSCGKPCIEVGDPDEESGGQDNAL